MARQDGNPAMKTSRSRCLPGVSLAGALACAVAGAHAAEAAAPAAIDHQAELARKLANPVASLISVPLQYNYDENIGLDDKGSKSVLNVQPVIPLSLSQDWNLIIRTIVPLIDQQDVSARGESESGMGDITQSFFFSPKAPVGGWILAAGPVGYYRSATDTQLGAEKWGAGPTALALKQTGPWTVGMLTNHIESFAGDDDRAEISSTFVQPFVAYITKTKTTFSVNTESTYDWETDHWSVPVNVAVAQMLKIGPQILQLQLGARYWAESPDNGPEGWGYRMQLTLLYPK